MTVFPRSRVGHSTAEPLRVHGVDLPTKIKIISMSHYLSQKTSRSFQNYFSRFHHKTLSMALASPCFTMTLSDFALLCVDVESSRT